MAVSDDPYEILGVPRDADAAAIRRAYRKLAKENHPDLHPGDKAAEERFKRVSAANALLSDEEQRGRYDRGEIDASGAPRAPEPPGYRGFAEGAEGGRYQRASGHPAGGWTAADWGDIFGDMFGAAGGPGAGAAGGRPLRGQDEHYALSVPFLDAVRGSTRRLTLPDGRTLDVRVPAGLADGQVLRLRGKGAPGWNGGPAGDALIEVKVESHPFFRREGADLHLELPVTLREAVLGAKVPVPTPSGTVTMTIPAHSETGRQLRLRGRGVPHAKGGGAGDLYVTLRIAATEADDALDRFLREWTPSHPVDPREGMV